MLFSPFVANSMDPLHLFSDGVFHEDCVHRHPLGAKAISVHDEVLRTLGDPECRVCAVCGHLITDPDDYVTTGYLTGDLEDPMFELNMVQLHRSHVSRWPRRVELRQWLEEAQAKGAWRGPVPL